MGGFGSLSAVLLHLAKYRGAHATVARRAGVSRSTVLRLSRGAKARFLTYGKVFWAAEEVLALVKVGHFRSPRPEFVGDFAAGGDR